VVYPDNPVRVGPEFLKLCDNEEPGRYIAQPKYDGYRRLAHIDAGKVVWQAKRHAEAAPMKDQCHYEAVLHHLDGVTLDCEYVGPRQCGGVMPAHRLIVFDVIRHSGEWLRHARFDIRLALLRSMGLQTPRQDKNPGLLDFFLEQMQDCTSEGIVVRRADSGLILDESRCRDNPMWWKIKNR
jgi:ATP-dependent DNA ligase